MPLPTVITSWPVPLPGGLTQTLSVTGAAASATGYNLQGPGRCDIVAFDVDGDAVRVLWDGTVPTATSGHVLPGGTAYGWPVAQYNAAQFILKTGSTTSKITASPFVAV